MRPLVSITGVGCQLCFVATGFGGLDRRKKSLHKFSTQKKKDLWFYLAFVVLWSGQRFFCDQERDLGWVPIICIRMLDRGLQVLVGCEGVFDFSVPLIQTWEGDMHTHIFTVSVLVARSEEGVRAVQLARICHFGQQWNTGLIGK